MTRWAPGHKTGVSKRSPAGSDPARTTFYGRPDMPLSWGSALEGAGYRTMHVGQMPATSRPPFVTYRRRSRAHG
jgi:hypothetical protein